jgi:hypothetical protein
MNIPKQCHVIDQKIHAKYFKILCEMDFQG